MKLPAILFVMGLIGLLGADYLNQVLPFKHLVVNPQEHPDAVAFLAKIDKVIDATGSSVVEQELAFGLCSRVDVNPGFRVIHDPTLGKEVIAKLPEIALPYLTLSGDPEAFFPDFNRPVKLKELVEIRINLHAHGSQRMRIGMNDPAEGRTRFLPDFVTEGPLQFTFLNIVDIPNHRIDIESEDVVVFTRDDITNLYGTAKWLEFLFLEEETKEKKIVMEAPNLRAEKVFRTNINDVTR